MTAHAVLQHASGPLPTGPLSRLKCNRKPAQGQGPDRRRSGPCPWVIFIKETREFVAFWLGPVRSRFTGMGCGPSPASRPRRRLPPQDNPRLQDCPVFGGYPSLLQFWDNLVRCLSAMHPQHVVEGVAEALGPVLPGGPARWAVSTTFSRVKSGLSAGGGSESNTSSPAPAIAPFDNAAASAGSSTTGPRLVLMR